MTNLERMKLRTGEADERILLDCLESAWSAIMARRFPYDAWPDEMEPRYLDLQYRCALDLYNRTGAEGQVSHTENGISRAWGAEWISQELLNEVVPLVRVVG